jgi:cyanate lyase
MRTLAEFNFLDRIHSHEENNSMPNPPPENTFIGKEEMKRDILHAKLTRKATWAQIAEAAGLSEVFTTSACLGENALGAEEAARIGNFLALSSFVVDALTRPANKGEAAPIIPKEPLQYRFQEILYVYGETLKELIEEKFGPGIMSAIDFTMDVAKQPDPKGDRVVITMNGKFLGYKKW